MSRAVRRLTEAPARAFVFAILLGYAIAATTAVSTHWHFEDVGSYWNAALRLQSGAPLYFRSQNLSDSALYWYSPWFAALWVPLTHLPRDLVMVGWGMLQLGAVAYLLRPSRHPASWALSLLLLPDLLRSASTGNVQVPMLALILIGLRSRWGPIAIGVAASLKVIPILFAVLYGWRKALISTAVAIALTAPILLFDVSVYPMRSLDTPLPLPLMWLVAVGGLALVRTRYRVLGVVVALLFVNPTWAPGTIGFLALARDGDRFPGGAPAQRQVVVPLPTANRE